MRSLAAIVLVAGCGRIDFGTGDGDGNGAACSAVSLASISLGAENSIGTATDGTYWGMGKNGGHELALTGAEYDVPQLLPLLAGMTSVSVGSSAGTAISPSGELETWGAYSDTPRTFSAVSTWSDPHVAWAWGCALQPDRSIWCWGDNYKGNLGDGTNNDSTQPIRVVVPPVASYSIGVYSAFVIDMTGAIWAWGDNSYMEAGIGPLGATQIQPTQVGTDVDWVQVSAGGASSCARKVNGTLWCWGQSYLDGTENNYDTPTQVGARTDWIDIEAGYEHACALAADHSVWCFGPKDHVPPTEVALPGPADSLVVGAENTCVSIAGALWCWGLDEDGELGNGSFTDVLLPVARCP